MKNSDSEITKKNTDFGSVLEVARKSQNYSIDDISEQLKIPAQTIAAIETNDIAALPPPTFTQGYIRTYAKFLEISEEHVLAIYNLAVPHDQAPKLKPRSNLTREASSLSLIMKTVTWLLIVAGITAVIYGSFQYYQKKANVMETELESRERSFTGNSLDSPAADRITIRQNARLSENDELIVLQPDPLEKVEITEMSETNASAADEFSADKTETTAEVADIAVTSVSEEQEPVADKSQEVAARVDVLKIYAEQGSWMQVRDASKKRLLYNMIAKGGGKVLQGQAPFYISLGNAKTTKLVINDLAIDMSGYILENNTATFTVSTEAQQVVFH
ncbi:MAG: helix-turn-helix domain-containing protein [Gammaproteobacteria bacterium]